MRLMVTGVPSSGKTTLARALAATLPGAWACVHDVQIGAGKALSGFYVEVQSGNFRDKYHVTDEGITWKDSRVTTTQRVTPQGDNYHLKALNGFGEQFSEVARLIRAGRTEAV